MKTIGSFLVIVIVVLVAVVFARNIVVKAAVENGVRVVTGMPLSMEKLDLNLTNTSVDIEGLVIKNPAGFHDTILVNIPKIFVDYNLTNILKGKIHLESLVFEIEQFSVVKNEQGKLNLDSLKALQRAKTETKPSQTEPQDKGKALPIQIDHFRLKVGKASYEDYSSGKLSSRSFNVGLDETYQDITDINKLVALIVVKVMMRTPLAMLSGFNLTGLQGSVSGILGSATDMAGQAASKGYDTLKSATTTAGEFAGDAGGVVKDTTGTVTGGVKSAASSVVKVLKFPFGKKE